MEKKGQGAIEYLLIIGAAILVVAVVIIALTSVSGTAADNTNEDAINDATLILECQQECGLAGGEWNTTTNTCSVDLSDTCEAFDAD